MAQVHDIPEAALLPLARALAPLVARELQSRMPGEDPWLARSALGARRHCKLCRERIAAGDPRATVVARKHLMRRSLVDELLRGMPGRSPGGAPEDHQPTPGDALSRELGIGGE